MNLTKIKASLFHAINYLKKTVFVYTKLKIFTPKPQSIYLAPGAKCNSRCIMCLSWLKKTKTIPFRKWKIFIDNIYEDWSRYLKINISGGEVLLPGPMKKVVDYSVEKLPYTGITSNGFLIDKKMAQSLISKKFSNINISIDGNTDKTVNLIRGRPYAFIKSRSAISFLVKEKKKQNSLTKIIIKTIIMGLNFNELPALVRWVKSIGADGIYFQPIVPIYDSQQTLSQLKKTSLWIQPQNQKKLIAVINKLAKMKSLDYPILNDYDNLELIKKYFCNNTNNIIKLNRSCTIDLTTLFIGDNGNIYFCTAFPPIGNIKNKKSLNEIITSDVAFQQRKKIRSCPMVNQCLSTCAVQKNLFQQIKLFLFLK